MTTPPAAFVDDDDDYVVVPPPISRGDTPVSQRRPTIAEGTGPSSRESTPIQRVVSYESLATRPRSNPRSRTPMRYESPLNADAFHRSAIENEEAETRPEGRRVTVRPLAGAAVGTALFTRRIEEETSARRSSTPKSSRQGPSHRKVRRWNNDNFVGLISDIAKASSRGPLVAETLLRAQADAHLYRSVYNPQDQPETDVTRFMKDEEYGHLRHQFFNGDIGLAGHTEPRQVHRKQKQVEVSPSQMLNRIHDRLRSVLVRGCCNSAETEQVVDQFQKCLVGCFSKKAKPGPYHIESLLEPPTVTTKRSGERFVRFHFDPASPSSGFHRLLLHAICQFHGLRSSSKSVEFSSQPVRVLTVTGTMTGAKTRLLDCLELDASGS